MLDCAYRVSGGTCSSGFCYTEPSCITDEPVGGWRRRDQYGRFVKKDVRE
jgi:hypothetical protein